ncbi:hypothetical protein PSPO01_07713 [Paraphaeosphaeria sporulosa]
MNPSISSDTVFGGRILAESILNDLGDFVDAFEGSSQEYVSRIKWSQITGLQSVTSKALSPATCVNFVILKANLMSDSYVAVDFTAEELLQFHNISSELFRDASARQVVEPLLQNRKSLHDVIDLLEQYASKTVSSYERLYPEVPATPGIIPHGLTTPWSQRESWWERFKRRVPSS